ncbi:MAG: sensor histidine kinase [Saccharofermentanales bacterium]|jgi:sensor histidine kinase YesM|nr:histidine kinase [Clostridiaceae bacterium]
MSRFAWKPTIVLKILLLELTISAILITILLALLPSIFYSTAASQSSENIRTASALPIDTVNRYFDAMSQCGHAIDIDEDFCNGLADRDRPERIAGLRRKLSEMYEESAEAIEAGMIVFQDGSVLADDSITEQDLAQSRSDWVRDFRAGQHLEACHLLTREGEAEPILYYVRRYTNCENGTAGIIFRCDIKLFAKAFDPLFDHISRLTLLDRDLTPIYPDSSEPAWLTALRPVLADQSPGQSIDNETTDGITLIHHLRHSNWRVVLEVTRQELLAPYLNAIKKVMLAIVLFFIILQLAIVIILPNILRPIHHLSNSLQQIAEGDLSVRVDIKTGDEIEMLGKSFNLMAEKLSANMQQLVENEKLNQQMKYSLLISQIDPHFIYNTMNTITYLARHGRNEDVIKVNRNLMDMLKDRLRVSADEFCDTLEREIEILKSYMLIQRYRYGDYFEVKWEIPDELLQIQVPKNIIQPIMENALYHGLLVNKDEDGALIGGLITVSVQRTGPFIEICVSDNGKGMEEWKAEAFNRGEDAFGQLRGEHIGLKNIRERMQYLYKQDYSMVIASAPDEGTTVRVQYREDKQG